MPRTSAPCSTTFFDVMTTIGYPPPWPLALGCSTATSPSAGLQRTRSSSRCRSSPPASGWPTSGAALQDLGAPRPAGPPGLGRVAPQPLRHLRRRGLGPDRRVVAVLAVGALVAGRLRPPAASALLLALAVCIKPIGWPLPLALSSVIAARRRRALRYAAVFPAGAAVSRGALPRPALGRDATAPPQRPVPMSGAMSLATVVRLWREPLVLAGPLVAAGPALDPRARGRGGARAPLRGVASALPL